MRTFLAFVFAVALLGSPVLASDKSELEAKGLKPATGQDIADFKVGKTCVATPFDESGNPQPVSTNVYRQDGTVSKEQGGDVRERAWRMDGDAFCETLYGNGNEWCGAHEVFHVLDDKMYIFSEDGAVRFIETCS
jgi:hypothetical protein